MIVPNMVQLDITGPYEVLARVPGWHVDYNNRQPHSSLDGLTPMEFVNRSKHDHNQNRFYL